MTGRPPVRTSRRGRPPSGESLSRADVVRAAAELADREGFTALSLAGVARVLGRHASSMYAHVGSLEELRTEVALLAATELADAVWAAVLGKVGAEALAAIAEQYLRYAASFPGRTASVAAVDPDNPEFAARMARLHEPLAAAFRSFGLDEAQAASAHRIFGATINGLVSTGGTAETDHAVELFVTALSTGAWPARPPRTGRARR